MSGTMIVHPDAETVRSPGPRKVRQLSPETLAMTRTLLIKMAGMLIGSRIDHPMMDGYGLQRIDHYSLPGVSQMPVPGQFKLKGVYRLTGDLQGRTVEIFLYTNPAGEATLDMRSDPVMPPEMRAQLLTCLFPMPMPGRSTP